MNNKNANVTSQGSINNTTANVVCISYVHTANLGSHRSKFMLQKGSGTYIYVDDQNCEGNRGILIIGHTEAHPISTKDLYFAINASVQRTHLVLLVQDEHCQIDHPSIHYRQFYGSQMHAKFFPLGPRGEFVTILPLMNEKPIERTFMFNFLGSITSKSREVLRHILVKKLNSNKFPSKVVFIKKWHAKVVKAYGYENPLGYARILFNSWYTLCPDGNHPESYRIYESLEAGSIPILALDEHYYEHPCQRAFDPFLEAKAPFIFLNSWNELPEFLERYASNISWTKHRQIECMNWYRAWSHRTILEFEDSLEHLYKTGS